jgi:hypothetical protein
MTIKIPDYKNIVIPSKYSYINQVPEFQVDLPDNVYIDKTVTGCGITTAVLQNNVDYIIAVPFIGLAENKLIQSESNPDLFKHELFIFHSKIDNKEIELSEYLRRNKNSTKKIIVTYDSLNKLKNLVSFKDYKLFIDEGHKLLEYAADFKPKVVNDLMNSIHDFKSFVIATATPNRLEYFPEQIKPLDKIKLMWNNCQPIAVNQQRVNQNQLRDSIVSLCLSHYRNEKPGNAYIFFNSVSNIAKICKDLKSFGLTEKDIKIITASNEDNQKTISKLGKNWKIKPVIEYDNNSEIFYKINFITSTAFEGQDFNDPDGIVYIISDSKLEHTKLDISTQIPQIAGRLRQSKYKDIINMIWTISPTLGISNPNEYKQTLDVRQVKAIDYMDVFEYATNKKSDAAQDSLIEGVKTDVFFIDMTEKEIDPSTNTKIINRDLIINPNAINCLMNIFVGMKLQYYVNMEKNGSDAVSMTEHSVKSSLLDVFAGKVDEIMIAPILSASDKRKLGKKGNFSHHSRAYIEALQTVFSFEKFGHPTAEDDYISSKKLIEDIESDAKFDTLVEYIKIFGTKDILSYSDESLKECILSKKINKHNEQRLLKEVLLSKFKPNDCYTFDEWKDLIQPIYDANKLSGKATTGDLNSAFEISQTSLRINKKSINYLKITGIK